jgi:tetratricopeptide (TPR) repeat protein
MTCLLLAILLVQDPAVAKVLRTADEAYAKRDEAGQPAAALAAYRKALAIDEACRPAYVGLAKTNFWIGTHEPDSEKAAAAFREGIDYCKIAVSVDAESVDAHFWLAILYGLFGQTKGIMQSLDLLDPLKAELDWVLKKNEAFEDAGAHRVYGRLYHKLPGVKGGDNHKAEKHLRRAIELAPKNLLNYHYLAEVLVAQGRREEAKEALRTMMAQPDDPRWKPESREQRADGRKLLEKLE